MSVSRLQVVIDGTTDGLNRSLQGADQRIKKFSDNAGSSLGRLEGRIDTFAKRAGAALAAVGVAMSVQTFTNMAQAALSTADAIDKASQRAGVTAEEWQRLAYAAGQSGVSASSLETALKRLNLNMAEGKVVASSMQEAFLQTADRIANAKTAAERAAIVFEAFGKSGADLLPLLMGGAEGVTELTERADRLGVVLSGDTIKKSVEFNDTLDDLKAVVTAIVQGALLETLTDHTEDLKAVLTDPAFIAGINAVASGIGVIGSAAAQTISQIGNLINLLRDPSWENAKKLLEGSGPGQALKLGEQALNTLAPPEPGHSKEERQAAREAQAAASNPVAVVERKAPRVVSAPAAEPAAASTKAVKSYGRAVKETAKDSEDFKLVMREVEEELSEAQRIFDATRTPMEKYQAEIIKLDKLLQSGVITQDTYARATQQAVERLTDGTDKLESSTSQLAEAGNELGLTFASAFEDAIVGGKAFSEVLQGLGQDIMRLTLRKTVTEPLTGALSSLLGGVTGSLFGGSSVKSAVPAQMAAIRGAFASGGWVNGPGTGTSDSILARLSNGEFVVTAEAAKRNRALLEAMNAKKYAHGGSVGGGPAGGIAFNSKVEIINQTSTPVQGTAEQSRGPDGQQLIRVIIKDVVNGEIRNGGFDQALGGRFGLNQRPIRR